MNQLVKFNNSLATLPPRKQAEQDIGSPLDPFDLKTYSPHTPQHFHKYLLAKLLACHFNYLVKKQCQDYGNCLHKGWKSNHVY